MDRPCWFPTCLTAGGAERAITWPRKPMVAVMHYGRQRHVSLEQRTDVVQRVMSWMSVLLIRCNPHLW